MQKYRKMFVICKKYTYICINNGICKAYTVITKSICNKIKKERMEREELEPKISEKLGSTQLRLSKETMDMFYEETLNDITDDSKVDDDFIERKVNYLKKLDGQLHSDVSREVKLYKEDWEKKNKKQGDKGGKGKEGAGEGHSSEGNDNEDEIQKLRKDFEDMKKAYAKEKESRQKDAILNDVEKGLKSKLSKAGIEVNSYFLRQVKKELDVTIDEDGNTPDVDELVSQAEKNYFKSLKEAGFERNTPPAGGRRTGKGAKSVVDNYFARKQQKEHWGKANK